MEDPAQWVVDTLTNFRLWARRVALAPNPAASEYWPAGPAFAELRAVLPPARVGRLRFPDAFPFAAAAREFFRTPAAFGASLEQVIAAASRASFTPHPRADQLIAQVLGWSPQRAAEWLAPLLTKLETRRQPAKLQRWLSS
jgi:hypothetical protein